MTPGPLVLHYTVSGEDLASIRSRARGIAEAFGGNIVWDYRLDITPHEAQGFWVAAVEATEWLEGRTTDLMTGTR